MKKYINLIISSISLFVTTLLLVVTIFSWYVTNDKAQVSGVVVTTASADVGFDLEYYNDEWTSVSSFDDVTKDLWPGDVIYFKIKIKNAESAVVSGSFKDLEVGLDTEKVTSDNSYIYYNNLKIEDYAVSAGKVSVTVTSTAYDLYNVAQAVDENENPIANTYTVSLADLLITDAIKIDNEPVITNDVPVSLNPDFDSLCAFDSQFFTGVTIDATHPIYFAMYYADGTYPEANTTSGFTTDTQYYTYTVAYGYKKIITRTSNTTYYTKSGNTYTEVAENALDFTSNTAYYIYSGNSYKQVTKAPAANTQYYTHTDNAISPFVEYYQYQTINIGAIGITVS